MWLKKRKESRGENIPMVTLMTPTQVSAAGLSLEVNSDTVRFSPEDFMLQPSGAQSSNQSKAREVSFQMSDVAPWQREAKRKTLRWGRFNILNVIIVISSFLLLCACRGGGVVFFPHLVFMQSAISARRNCFCWKFIFASKHYSREKLLSTTTPFII